jgi:hypothetical protein
LPKVAPLGNKVAGRSEREEGLSRGGPAVLSSVVLSCTGATGDEDHGDGVLVDEFESRVEAEE